MKGVKVGTTEGDKVKMKERERAGRKAAAGEAQQGDELARRATEVGEDVSQSERARHAKDGIEPV